MNDSIDLSFERVEAAVAVKELDVGHIYCGVVWALSTKGKRGDFEVFGDSPAEVIAKARALVQQL